MKLINLAEKKWLPDAVIRMGIRRLCQQRLNTERGYIDELGESFRQNRFSELKQSPIAIETDAANEQHYEVPAAFYQLVLGDYLKYSACLWDKETKTLSQAEANMLELYAKRAQLENGQRVLDLGCGWGSFSLWAAGKYPESQFTAVSNSSSQRRYIENQAKLRGLNNLRVLTCDVNELSFDTAFDRIVSVEMLEHVRNYDRLFERISRWLHKDGLMFVHIFCHQNLVYPFETEGEDNWMGRYFFTGGLMPSVDTFSMVQQHLNVKDQWTVNGTHYAKTAEAWLDNTDQHEKEILALFEATYGKKEAPIWLQRWRIFFMSCAELFAYDNGDEWIVSHYTLGHSDS